jgi:hypothetical protein
MTEWERERRIGIKEEGKRDEKLLQELKTRGEF